MRILDLEFKDLSVASENVNGGFVVLATASSSASGNKVSLAIAKTFTFQASGGFGKS